MSRFHFLRDPVLDDNEISVGQRNVPCWRLVTWNSMVGRIGGGIAPDTPPRLHL